MISILKKQSVIYGISGLAFGITSTFIRGSLDVMINDTYFVIAKNHLLFLFVILYILFSLLSFIVESLGKKVNKTLFGVNYILFTLCILWFIYLITREPKQNTFEDYSILNEVTNKSDALSTAYALALLILTALAIWQFLVLGTALFRAFSRR